jgi:polysaccharide export outer membrane protein
MALAAWGVAVGLAGAQTPAPRIGVNDQLSVVAFGQEKLTGKYLVSPQGTIEFPHVGAVRAAGLTAAELAATLGQRLVEGGYFTRAPQLTVEFQVVENKRITVTGEVHVQGAITFAGRLTLFDALVKAGMPTAAAGDEVMVVRPRTGEIGGDEGEDQIITANLADLRTGNVSRLEVPLEHGDRVIVNSALKVFISGYVASPNAYAVPPGSTVEQALALAGGVTERGSKKGIRILRPVAGRKAPQELKDVKLTDFVKPGDTIIVRARIL